MVELGFRLVTGQADGQARPAWYTLEIGRDPADRGGHVILREQCRLELAGNREKSFQLTPDGFESTLAPGEKAERMVLPSRGQTDRLLLPLASVLGLFPSMESALLDMAFYDFTSAALRAVDDGAPRRTRLGEDGSHIGHVLGLMAEEHPSSKELLDGQMRAVVPGILGVDERREGDFSALQARFWTGESSNPLPYWEAVNSGRVRAGDPHVAVFHHQQLSEGTVRAAGVLTALAQPDALSGAVPFLSVEEPELAVHPSRVAAIFEAAHSTSQSTQVLLTTQSSDLLDDEYVRPEHLRMVEMVNGVTYVGGLDARMTAALTERPSLLPELHRKQQLKPLQLTASIR
ncbi:AAA family ATPase [Streptomyces sp. HB2AG]|uniref:AAA family ATPase n=1 Tax=Streptomyces sp. HB2AG TaxID=2983400 RepID=UPI0022AAD84F|nr:AAA family ATPase [Streptomyces sp. HB2AG]MCZ2525379.1 AAA family ATPase [Streptomyces sp. HB2AG]